RRHAARGARRPRGGVDARAADAEGHLHRLARPAPGDHGHRSQRPAARAEPLAGTVRHGRRRGGAARRAVDRLRGGRHPGVADRRRHRAAGAGRAGGHGTIRRRDRRVPARRAGAGADARTRTDGRGAVRHGRASGGAAAGAVGGGGAAGIDGARRRGGGRPRMNMRVLFAIHGPADQGTAVYRAVHHRVAALREHGHQADLLAAGDLRGRGPARLDPLLLAPALSRRRLARYDAVVFHSHLGWAFHAARPWLDPDRRVVTITSFHGLEPIYYAALARELARQGERLSARFRMLHGQVVPRLLRFSCRQSDAVFCLNSNEAHYLTANGWAAPERIYRLTNGVESECFMDRAPAARVRRL